MSYGEFSLIETFFSRIGESSAIELGIGDDAATVRVPDGHALQISTDTAIEGVCIFPQTSLRLILLIGR